LDEKEEKKLIRKNEIQNRKIDQKSTKNRFYFVENEKIAILNRFFKKEKHGGFQKKKKIKTCRIGKCQSCCFIQVIFVFLLLNIWRILYFRLL